MDADDHDGSPFGVPPTDPGFPAILEGFRVQARANLRMGIPAESLALVNRILQNAPTAFIECEDYLISGSALVAMDRVPESIDSFTNAIRCNPQSLAAFYNRAFQNASLENYCWAIRDYTVAISLSSKDPYSYYNRGWVRRRAGLLSDALCDYTEAIRLRSSFSEPFGDRAYTRLLLLDEPEEKEREFYEAIRSDLEKALSLGYRDNGVMSRWSWRLAFVHLHLGNFDSARVSLRESYEFDPHISKLDSDLLIMKHLCFSFGRFFEQGAFGEIDEDSPEEVVALKSIVDVVLSERMLELEEWERTCFVARLVRMDIEEGRFPPGKSPSPLPSTLVTVSTTRRVLLNVVSYPELPGLTLWFWGSLIPSL